MKFHPTPLAGAFVVEIEPKGDERGFFARTFCAGEFAARGLDPAAVQISISFNRKAGTLRGMHWQAEPHAETKLVRCTRGALHDVVVDLRPDSPTFRRSYGLQLDAESRRALYIPKGLAHGFLTLEDDTEILYQMSVPFAPDGGRGARWNDPAFGIVWPFAPLHMNDRDRTWPDFTG